MLHNNVRFYKSFYAGYEETNFTSYFHKCFIGKVTFNNFKLQKQNNIKSKIK